MTNVSNHPWHSFSITPYSEPAFHYKAFIAKTLQHKTRASTQFTLYNYFGRVVAKKRQAEQTFSSTLVRLKDWVLRKVNRKSVAFTHWACFEIRGLCFFIKALPQQYNKGKTKKWRAKTLRTGTIKYGKVGWKLSIIKLQSLMLFSI